LFGLKFLYFLNEYQNSAQTKIANIAAKSGAFGVSSIGKTAKIKAAAYLQNRTDQARRLPNK
jgi:hypothetical protein